MADIRIIDQQELTSLENDAYVVTDNSSDGTHKYNLKRLNTAISTVQSDISTINDTLETKADDKGSYNELTAGSAEQLLSDKYTIDQVPYTFRTSGGSDDIGDREYDEIVGGSIVWNSLAKFNQTDIPSASNGITYAYTDGNSVLINGTATANETRTGWFALNETNGLGLDRLNHKVLFYPKLISGTVEGSVSFTLPSSTSAALDTAKIGVLGYSNTNQIRGIHYIANGTVCTNAKITILCADLTAMFGSTVADYIYSLEQTTAGAGVAWFKKFFPKDYYAYDAGTMKHVSDLQSHDMVGFNAWDEEWEVGAINTTNGANASASNIIRSKNYISVFPNTVYCKQAPVNLLQFYYDASKNFLSYGMWGVGQFTTPQNCAYVRFYTYTTYGNTYNHDICINLSWSGTRNGEYEPYVKHAYPLDSSLTLRGIPKLDASGNLYYDGDTYAPDGTVTRKYGIVDLGTAEWIYHPTQRVFSFNLASMVRPCSLVCSKYPQSYTIQIEDIPDKTIWNERYAFMSKNVCVKDTAYTDAATFKTAMSGVMLVYELATPTTETATPYRSLQKVDPYGTEEYVSTSLVPVGHYTKYPENLKAKIENLDLSMIAPIEKGTTASQAYAVGKYFLLNNKFCKAKTAIASGATFTLNTNYEVTTIADELYTALNA